ncbi:MAG TPA: Gfo/Idh/MocA family oxidoreductase, partial [Acidobacteriota bacterium]|nr:Gfo/Idh/MocA family oxidoreductase [Acidobacteriota bacterium]
MTKWHIGFLGAGNITETHMKAAAEIEDLEIVAVSGQNAERVANLAEEFKCAGYGSEEEFWGHRPLDIVAIGSPSGVHAKQGIEAAARGIHVLVEKPIDVTLEEADRLISVCQENQVQLGVFFQDRVNPDFIHLKQLLDSGTLGRPLITSAQVKWFRPPEYYSQSRWRGTWQYDGGGALINQAIHTVDLMLWLLGPVKKASSLAATRFHDIEVEDALVGIL